MSASQTNEMTVNIAREVISQVRPNELAGFDDQAEEFLQDPEYVRQDLKRRAQEGAQEGAFGVGEIVAVAPIALTVSHEVIHFLMGPVVKEGFAALLKSLFSEGFKIFFQKLFKPKPQPPEIKLTQERLQERMQAAKELAGRVARESGLKDERVTQMVNITIEYLMATLPNEQASGTLERKT